MPTALTNTDKPTTELFGLRVLTDQFAPRAKPGEVLMMQRGLVAEEGDIVASGDDLDCPTLAFYSEGLDYAAVAVAVHRKVSQRLTHNDKQDDPGAL